MMGVPARARDKVHIGFRFGPSDVVLFERRPEGDTPAPCANMPPYVE
jgi:hypothetical protein